MIKNLLQFHLALSKFKHFEIQIFISEAHAWFDFSIGISRKVDHAGFYFEFEIFKLNLNMSIYDSRHWDEKIANWQVTE